MEAADKEAPAAITDDECFIKQNEAEVTRQSVRVPGLSYHTSQMAPLIGTRTEVECVIGCRKINALWDSGSQVFLISQGWLEERNPLQ